MVEVIDLHPFLFIIITILLHGCTVCKLYECRTESG